jgi:hypothetical protein
MVRRRHVFYVEGYDPQGIPGYFALFRREFARFLKLWPLRASFSNPVVDDDANNASWQVQSAGPNWQVDTVYEMLTWHDLVRADLARPLAPRMLRVALAYADFLFTGTLTKIFRASWRFGLFFIFPAVVLSLTLVIAIVLGVGAHDIVRLHSSAVPAIVAGLSAFLLYLLIARRILDWWFAIQLAEMWRFVRDQIHGHCSTFDVRVGDFAERIIAKARAGDVDEIFVVGHSCGGLVALLAAAAALKRDADVGRHGPRIVILSLGSIMPAAALHPAATAIRSAIARLANERNVAWIKFQSRKDVINVYKFDPVRDLGIAVNGARQNPLVVPVRFSECLEPETYRRFRLNFFRMHFQFIMANDRRAPYDYFLYLFGPAGVSEWATMQRSMLAAFKPDAAFEPPATTAFPANPA